MVVGRNKDNKQLKKDFDKWKKDAKDRVNKLKHGVLTEDEVYEWLVNNIEGGALNVRWENFRTI